MRFEHFTTQPRYYTANHKEASSLETFPATITRPTGDTEPGVVVLVGHRVKLALNTDQAYRLANSLADALETARTK